MPSNPSFVGAGANPGFESIGTRVGNFLSGMNLGDQSSVHSHSLDGSLLAGGPDPNRGLNRGATYGRDGEKTSITTDSKFGLKMREAMNNWSMSDIQA